MDPRDKPTFKTVPPKKTPPTALAPPTHFICFFDDEPIHTNTLQKLFTLLEFTDTNIGQPVNIGLLCANRVKDLFEFKQFTHPTETAPFLVVLMDEQHSPHDKPSDGGKLTRTIMQGTVTYKALEHLGTLPGGYTGKVVMYSTNIVYSPPGETATDISQAQKKRLQELGLTGIMMQGFQKSPMLDTLVPMLNQVLAEYNMSVKRRPLQEKKRASFPPLQPLTDEKSSSNLRNKLHAKRKFNSSSALGRAQGLVGQGSPSSAPLASLPFAGSPFSPPSSSLFGPSAPTRQTSAPFDLSNSQDAEVTAPATPPKIQLSQSSGSPIATTPTIEESPPLRINSPSSLDKSPPLSRNSPSNLERETTDALSGLDLAERPSPTSSPNPNRASPSTGKSRFTQFNQSTHSGRVISPSEPDATPTSGIPKKTGSNLF